MDLTDLEHFRDLLSEREETLHEWMVSCGDVDDAETHKVNELLGEIKSALGRIEDHSFGTCKVCQGTVELHRLEVQPVREVCIECFSEDEKRELEHEMFLASRIHRALLPQNVERIDGFDIAVKSLAARVVGGDYYDFLPPGESGLVRVVIADTMGKGLPAGLVMSNLQGAMRILANEIESPAKLLASLNRWLCRNIPVESFVSLACVGLRSRPDGSTEVVQANAGHCPTIVAHADGSVDLLEATGTFVGVHEDFTYTEETTTLSPGDLLVLYTDGVTEAESPHDEMFGDERLIEFVRQRRGDPVKEIIEALTNEILVFSDRPDMADDFTVMALRKAS